MKKYLTPYKIINIVMLVVAALAIFYAHTNLKIPCPDGETISCLYESKYAFLQPLYGGGLILSITLGGLLLVPSDLFRKWLWYIFPIAMIHTVWWISNISVYSGNILTPDRGQAARSNMEFYGVITLVFVLGHIFFWQYKKYKSRSS